MFAQFTALIDAGATLDELYKWYLGEYPIPFLALVQVGIKDRKLIASHSEAEAQAKANKGK